MTAPEASKMATWRRRNGVIESLLQAKFRPPTSRISKLANRAVQSQSSILRTLGLFSISFGFDPRRLRLLSKLARFFREYRTFRRAGGRVKALFPILSDYDESAGQMSGHYFHQDLLVAKFVREANPRRHIDVGSRIDGFVAHIATFRDIELIDIRPLRAAAHPQIQFLQADMMQPTSDLEGVADSVSSLHALEHFGLGRYGDSIHPQGHVIGFRNIAKLVEPGGKLYIGLPIGRATEVFFNALRIMDPAEPPTWFEDPTQFRLDRFDYVDDSGDLHTEADANAPLGLVHGCGIYTFTRLV